MMNRKASTNFMAILLVITLTIGLFYGTYGYISSNYIDSGIADNSVYNQSLLDLETTQDTLATRVDTIKSATQNISEADAVDANVAWNGLKGIASTLRLFISVAGAGINVWNAVLPGLSFLPTWLIMLVEMMIIVTIVLAVLGAFKGEAKTLMAWDYPTNFSNGTATVDGIGSIFQYGQYATGDMFGLGIIIMIWLISFGVGSMVNIGRAFASACFIALVFSVYFARIEALNPVVPFILASLTIIGFFWAKNERSASY